MTRDVVSAIGLYIASTGYRNNRVSRRERGSLQRQNIGTGDMCTLIIISRMGQMTQEIECLLVAPMTWREERRVP